MHTSRTSYIVGKKLTGGEEDIYTRGEKKKKKKRDVSGSAESVRNEGRTKFVRRLVKQCSFPQD